jgi:CubicO group peptidase (beta-lactamase class C family)
MTAAIVERLTALEPTIEKICAVAGAPGLSLGVSHCGKIIYTDNFGYRDVESSIAPDSDTVYGIGSVTKIFTASAIGALIDEGKLELTTPVVKILPDLNSENPVLRDQLTVKDLLTHQIGLEKSNNWWFGSDGVLLLDKSQTLSSFNALRSIAPFRTKFEHTNWGYTLVGEVIEAVSGVSYGEYLQSKIWKPLQLEHTTASHDFTTWENFAKPYAALDDGSMHRLPPPPIRDGTIMVAAQGIQSSVNDLLRFSSALLEARKGESSPLKGVNKQFAGHIFRGTPLLDKSYGLGLMRSMLPGTIGGGCNSQFVKLPKITPSGNTRLLVFHGGSQAGYTSFLTMLPEADLSIVVLANSAGLGDPAAWINEVLVEALVDSPNHTDFIKYATEAAKKHIASYPAMERKLEETRTVGTHHNPLQEYVGRYINPAHSFVVEIRKKDEDSLQVAFQDLDSQLWSLRHYEYDTFLWLSPRDEQAKRARFTYASASVYKIIFNKDMYGTVDGLFWPHEPGLPEKKQWFEKEQSPDGDGLASNDTPQVILKAV